MLLELLNNLEQKATFCSDDFGIILKSRLATRGLICLAILDPVRLSISQFGAFTGSSPAWSSRLIDGFVKAGFANLIPNDKDRRISEIELTPQAKIIASRVWVEMEPVIAAALEETEPEKRPILRQFLLTLTRELRKRIKRRQSERKQRYRKLVGRR